MSFQRKKIALIFATGSLVSIRNNKSIFFVDKESDIKQWLNEVTEISLLADIEPFFLLGESGFCGIDAIEKVVQVIRERQDTFDGFVVLVRGESMIQAAVAAEFMLQ